MTLYTKFPGYYIGYHGERVERYRNRLREIGVDRVILKELAFVVKPMKGSTK